MKWSNFGKFTIQTNWVNFAWKKKRQRFERVNSDWGCRIKGRMTKRLITKGRKDTRLKEKKIKWTKDRIARRWTHGRMMRGGTSSGNEKGRIKKKVKSTNGQRDKFSKGQKVELTKCWREKNTKVKKSEELKQ